MIASVAVALSFAIALQTTPTAPAPAAPRAPQAPAPPAPRALEPSAHAINFTDASAASGLSSISTVSGAMPSTAVLEVKGGGLLTLDFDNDGDMDLFVPNGATLADTEHGPGAKLLRNKGDGTFVDVTAASGITHTRWSFGGAVGDFDGDNLDDIFIACFGKDVLLRSKGDGRFEDVTEKAGINIDGWSSQAAFADLDGDGDLDLVVARYLDFDPKAPLPPTVFKGVQVMSGPRGYRGSSVVVLENKGDGTFADRSESSGVRAAKPSYGLALVVLDFDGNGTPDIFVGNDSQPNQLFMNKGGFKFEEQAMKRGVATNMEGSPQATMGTAIADVNGDGRPDLHIAVFSSDTNTLFVNSEKAFFDDRSNQYGVGAPSRSLLGWASMFGDFDQDGEEDLITFNGHVYPQATVQTMDSAYEQPALVLRRSGPRFEQVAGGDAMKSPHRDRAAVTADFDGDGDLDIVVAGLNQPLRFLRNDHAKAEDWLLVTLRDDRTGAKNKRGLGSRVQVEDAKGRVRTRWLWSGGPFMSNWAPMAHFGLGAETGPLTVKVRWPDGWEQSVPGIVPGSTLLVTRED